MTYLFVFFYLLLPQAQSELTVSFSGMEHSKGKVYVELRNEKNQIIDQAIVTVKDQKARQVFKVSQGRIAVSAFYDANNNGKLDKNFMGMPTEKYGFSNNARGTFGPPDLKVQLVDLQSNKQIDIQLK